jgi:hypothetical protein
MYQVIDLGKNILPQLEEYAIKAMELAYDKIPLVREYVDLYTGGLGDVFQVAALITLVGMGSIYSLTEGSFSLKRGDVKQPRDFNNL